MTKKLLKSFENSPINANQIVYPQKLTLSFSDNENKNSENDALSPFNNLQSPIDQSKGRSKFYYKDKMPETEKNLHV